MFIPSLKYLMIFSLIKGALAVDYCKLCTNPSLNHIACNHNENFARSCPSDAKLITLSNENIQTLLNAHNYVRNKIAGGNQTGFESASKMLTLVWDYELAYLAELNVKQCKIEHDECRDTEKYRDAGQNIYLHWTTGNYGDLNSDLKEATFNLYEEVNEAAQSDINELKCDERFSDIAHFTLLVNENVSAVGCAVARYTEDFKRTTLITCNYSYNNYCSDRVYNVGPPASSCEKGRNYVFENLCN